LCDFGVVELRHIEKREFIQLMQEKAKDAQRVGVWCLQRAVDNTSDSIDLEVLF
jgi:hypothetical protein